MASPPKPWERQGATSATPSSLSSTTSTTMPATNTNTMPATATTTATSTTSSASPAIPARPATLAATVNQNAAAYSRPYGAAPYGANPYSAYTSAYTSPYGSPYSRLGGYGAGMYGSGMYGGYGGYGGYGTGMYGAGMYGGMAGDPNNPESLTQRFNMSTAATFQMLEGIVGTFGGFAQMLESTYMATHSSFFAMVSVAEQFGNLRDALGSVLGIFTLMRWIRNLIAKLTGRPPPVDAKSINTASFSRFEGRQSSTPGAGGPPKPSRKPLLFFLLAAFGLPYVMSKLIRSLAANAEEERRRHLVAAQQPLDPSQLEFCRVLYDFSPSTQGQAVVQGVDLEVRKGDLVAVLAKSDPLGNPSEWWKCRARDGRIGYLPSTFLEVVRKPGAPIPAVKDAASESSRTNSLTSSVTAPGALPTATPPPLPTTKVGDLTVDSFQKSQFYS